MLRVYVTYYGAFKAENQFFFDIKPTQTFKELKLEILKKTAFQTANQKLFIGMKKKICMDDFEDGDSMAVGTLLQDQAQLFLELRENVNVTSPSEGFHVISDFITCKQLDKDIPKSVKKNIQDECFLVYNFISPEEARRLIDHSETFPYVQVGASTKYRSNVRVILKDKNFAMALFPRIKQLVPCIRHDIEGSSWQVHGLNESFRFCRYTSGQHFSKHCDSFFARNDNETSMYTINIYLNTKDVDFTGGYTRFFKHIEDEAHANVVAPVAGLALVFEHFKSSQIHDGEILDEGVKYILRTDVMYRRIIKTQTNVTKLFDEMFEILEGN